MYRAAYTLFFLLFTCLSISASAQLRDGSIAPNFTLKDVNGNVHDLYTYLDQGKTVYLEFFTTWCAPCISYHSQRHLDSLFREHGPQGMPGVSATTTNDVMVIAVEIEHNNTWEELYGLPGGGYDWITGTSYPTCDTPGAPALAIIQDYEIEYIPTLFMICRDRLTKQLYFPRAEQAYQQTLNCPHYAPSPTVDAKAVTYQDKPYFICEAKPKVRFQNYSETSHITNATINIKNGSNIISTYNWVGDLQPYDVATVSMPAFLPASFTPYTYEVKVTGDSKPVNDKSSNSIFKAYGSANALSFPHIQNYEQPDPRLSSSDDVVFQRYGKWWDSLGNIIDIIGADNQATTCLLVAPGNAIIGNYNTSGTEQLGIQFDYSMRYNASFPPDTLIVEVSTDCGIFWKPVWNGTGANLAPPVAYAGVQSAPGQAGNWRHFTADIRGYQSQNLMVRVRFRNEYGWGFLDNIMLTPWSTSVSVLERSLSLEVYPNPVSDVLTARYTAVKAAPLQVTLLNTLGQVVYTNDHEVQAGINEIDISVARLPAGNYVLRAQCGEAISHNKIVIAGR